MNCSHRLGCWRQSPEIHDLDNLEGVGPEDVEKDTLTKHAFADDDMDTHV